MSDATRDPRAWVGRLVFDHHRSWALALAAVAVLVFLPYFGLAGYLPSEVALVLIYAMVISGLNVAFGYAGELALGQVFLFALGAYVAGALNVHGTTNALIGIAAAGLAAGLAGVVVGLPGLYLGKYTFAMISFFLVTLIPALTDIFQTYTGGAVGLIGVLPPTLFGSSLDGNSLYIFIVLVVAAWFVLCRGFLLSPYGRALRVVKESGVLAQSAGMSVYRMRVMAYVIAAVPAGIAGAMFAYLYNVVAPSSFALYGAIGVFAGSLLGGAVSLYGAVIGAAIVEGGPIISTAFSQYAAVAYGLMLVIGGVLLRGGLTGLLQSIGFIHRNLARYGPAARLARVQPTPLEEFLPKGEQCVVTDARKSFGGAVALDGVSVVAEAGKITALVGANGSGKTTLLNIISGFYSPDAGEVRLGADRLTSRRSWWIARSGVARTFQTPSIPKGLTVTDVVGAAQFSRHEVGLVSTVARTRKYRRVSAEQLGEVLGALSALGLAGIAGREASSLSLGTRRLVEVARALVGRPRLILLDEPASCLDEAEIDTLREVLMLLRSWGTSVLLVEHNAAFVAGVADRTYVFSEGRVVSERGGAAVAEPAEGT
jgi:branched-chain amino acid transport system permease protein